MPRLNKTLNDLRSGAHARLYSNRNTSRTHNQRRAEESSHSKPIEMPTHFNGKRSRALVAYKHRNRK